MEYNRRIFLAASSLAMPSLALSGCASSSEFSDLYDFSKPEQNLEAFAKVMGDLEGRGAWFNAKGQIYLIREGEMPLPFLGVEGLRYVKFERIEGGFRQYIRDWAFYQDRNTGEILTEFANPITGVVNAPKPILTPFFNWSLTAEKGQYMEGYTGDAWLIDRPFQLPWVQQGNEITVTLELLVRYASGTGGGEWVHFLTDTSELNDPTKTSADCRMIWTGHSPIMRWLDMENVKGRTLWQSTGRKLTSAEEVRPEFREAVNTYYPGSLEDPEGYEKPA